MSAIIKPRRARAGSFDTFVRRYEPIDAADGGLIRSWDDPDILKAFDEKRFEYVWTVVDGASGKSMYLVPGFTTVNYVGRVLCAKPWPPEEDLNTGYVY